MTGVLPQTKRHVVSFIEAEPTGEGSLGVPPPLPWPPDDSRLLGRVEKW